MSLAGRSSGEVSVAALIDRARNAGLDLRQRMFVAFVIDFGAQREDAYAAARLIRNTEWDSALYGDTTGWVVRLSRTQRLTSAALADDITEVNRVCRHGSLRGITVEDLRQDDVWGEMAARLQDGSRRSDDASAAAASVPVPRAPLPMHA